MLAELLEKLLERDLAVNLAELLVEKSELKLVEKSVGL